MTRAKNILKALFPRLFLKKAVLLYTIIKAKSFDKIFFKAERIVETDFIVHEHKNPFLELGIDVSNFDVDVRTRLTLWQNPDWTQDQYLLHYPHSGYIDSATGWALSKELRLIYPSLGFSMAPHVQKPSFFQTYSTKKNVTSLDRIVSLRDSGEENYFHFFNDIIAKLFFLVDYGVVLQDYTIVVAKVLSEKQYFKQFIAHSVFKDLRWHFQDKETVRFESALFCKPYTHTVKYLLKTADVLFQTTKPIQHKRIFLNRSPATLRFLENLNEIRTILHRYNFEIVDNAALSVHQQGEIYANCRYLIAIHGAGITNMLFRHGSPMSVLEIIGPSEYLPFHYIMLAKQLNYDYDALVGFDGTKAGDGGFRIVPADLEDRLEKMINADKKSLADG